MVSSHEIECETSESGGRWYIPAPIVYGVIITVFSFALGGGGAGALAAFKLNSALDKIHNLPTAQQMKDWKNREQRVNARQDARISRLESKVFHLQALHGNAYRYRELNRYYLVNYW